LSPSRPDNVPVGQPISRLTGYSVRRCCFSIDQGKRVYVALGRFPVLSTLIYVLMGWLLVLGIKPVLNFVPLHGFLWLLGGGLFYTVGVFFFASKRISYSHAIWHVFVLCGSVCHYWAVLRFPREPGTYSAHRTRMRASKLRPFPTSRPCSL